MDPTDTFLILSGLIWEPQSSHNLASQTKQLIKNCNLAVLIYLTVVLCRCCLQMLIHSFDGLDVELAAHLGDYSFFLPISKPQYFRLMSILVSLTSIIARLFVFMNRNNPEWFRWIKSFYDTHFGSSDVTSSLSSEKFQKFRNLTNLAYHMHMAAAAGLVVSLIPALLAAFVVFIPTWSLVAIAGLPNVVFTFIWLAIQAFQGVGIVVSFFLLTTYLRMNFTAINSMIARSICCQAKLGSRLGLSHIGLILTEHSRQCDLTTQSNLSWRSIIFLFYGALSPFSALSLYFLCFQPQVYYMMLVYLACIGLALVQVGTLSLCAASVSHESGKSYILLNSLYVALAVSGSRDQKHGDAILATKLKLARYVERFNYGNVITAIGFTCGTCFTVTSTSFVNVSTLPVRDSRIRFVTSLKNSFLLQFLFTFISIFILFAQI